MERFIQKTLILNIILIVFLTIDRLTKLFSLKELPVEGVFLIPGFLKLALYRNINIAFGIHLPLPLLYSLIILILFLLISFSARAYRQKDVWLIFWLGLIIAGALGNLLDRLFYGQVIDFLEVPFWSVFNLADAFIVLGLLGWLVKKLKNKNSCHYEEPRR